ncbi:MAG: transcriptional repressor [Clostridiales bacterium]|nr:transcriptional repressor [Clostridiales bacterium]
MQSGRNTKQKQHIVSILKNSDRPLSINEIYNKIINDLPRIAKSTIYRNIDILLDNNLIEKYYFNDSEVFYRYKENRNEHAHFIFCDECKNVYDLPFCPLRELEESIEADGFIIKEHQLQITGICRDCAQNHVN